MHSRGYENGLESITDKGSLDPVPSKNNIRVRENGTYDLRTQLPHSTLPLRILCRGAHFEIIFVRLSWPIDILYNFS